MSLVKSLSYEFRVPPFEHQLRELEEHARAPFRAMLWEMGTGKTKAAIDNAALLYLLGDVDAVLMVAPTGIPQNWLNDELPAHLPERLMGKSKMLYWRTKRAKTKDQDNQLAALVAHEGMAWLMMTYSAFVTDAGKQAAWKLLKHRKVMFLCDEASDLKSPSTARTRTIIKAGKHAPFRRIMEGTPVTTGPFDLYAPVRFLDENFWEALGFGTFAEYKAHFGVFRRNEFHDGRPKMRDYNNPDPAKRGNYVTAYFDKLVGYRRLEELKEILAQIGTRVRKDEVLDLPPKLYEKRYFELTPRQRDMYKKLRDEFMVEHAGGLVTATLAITRLLRFQQITCGYLPSGDDSDEQVPIEGGNPRLDLALEEFERVKSQGIIWCRFTPDVDNVLRGLEGLGMSAVRYDGLVDEDERERNKQAFNAGDRQWFVGKASSGGRGLTLLGGVYTCYYSNAFSLKQRLQSEDRPHRSGQRSACTYVDLLGEHTVDDAILKCLRNNFDIATQITGDNVREWI